MASSQGRGVACVSLGYWALPNAHSFKKVLLFLMLFCAKDQPWGNTSVILELSVLAFLLSLLFSSLAFNVPLVGVYVLGIHAIFTI